MDRCVCVYMWKCVCACVKWILCLKCPEVVVHVVQQAWPSSFKTADWMFFTLGLVGRVSLVKLALQNYNTICLSGTTCANQTSDFPVLKILSTDYPCRRKVYEILQRHGVDVPKYVVLNRPETESCKSYHVMWGHLVSCGIMLCQVICHMIDVMWCQGVLWCYMMLCMSCDVRWYVTWCNVMGCHSCVMWCHVSHDVMSHDVCRDIMVYVMWCHMMWCGVVWCHVVLCILSCIHNVVYSKRVTFLQLFSLPFIFFSPSSSLSFSSLKWYTDWNRWHNCSRGLCFPQAFCREAHLCRRPHCAYILPLGLWRRLSKAVQEGKGVLYVCCINLAFKKQKCKSSNLKFKCFSLILVTICTESFHNILNFDLFVCLFVCFCWFCLFFRLVCLL